MPFDRTRAEGQLRDDLRIRASIARELRDRQRLRRQLSSASTVRFRTDSPFRHRIGEPAW
jgi:hypothetical protein